MPQAFQITLGRDYRILGKGHKPVLAFHGFSQWPEVFEKLAEQAPSLKIYSFSLYGHPHTTPNYTKAAWLNAMRAWIEKEGLTTFQVIAFSLGARHALALMEEAFPQLYKVILLAPDGLIPHPIFSFATGSSFGRWCFQKLLQGNFVPNTANRLIQLKLLPLFTKKFMEQQFSSKALRMRIYYTWMHYASWKGSPKHIASKLSKDVALGVIAAKKDVFVCKKGGKRLVLLHEKAWQEQMPCDHFYLLSYYIQHYQSLPDWAKIDVVD